MTRGIVVRYAGMNLRFGGPPREVVAVRCWRTGSPEPEGASDFPPGKHPPNWLKEEPDFAAELYALECNIPADKNEETLLVSVRDERDVVTHYKVRLVRTIEAKVEKLYVGNNEPHP